MWLPAFPPPLVVVAHLDTAGTYPTPRCALAVYPSTGGCRERKLATQTLVEFVDDLDGSPGAETVRFGLDGREYEIDLKGKHAKALRKAVGKFATKGRPVRQKPAGRTMQTRERAARVRMWARKNGYEVGAKGRIPAEIEAAFNAALRNTRTLI